MRAVTHEKTVPRIVDTGIDYYYARGVSNFVIRASFARVKQNEMAVKAGPGADPIGQITVRGLFIYVCTKSTTNRSFNC